MEWIARIHGLTSQDFSFIVHANLRQTSQSYSFLVNYYFENVNVVSTLAHYYFKVYDFQSTLCSLSTSMFGSLTRWNYDASMLFVTSLIPYL